MNGSDSDKTPPRILVVDDSRMIRSMLLRLLEPLEAVVATAEHGEEALELARTESFDLVISDIEMPRMDGFELCRRLKQDPDTRGIPIIILSTVDTEESIEKGFTLGVAAYVTKRNVNEDLIPRIQEVLRRTFVLKGRVILLVDDSPFILKTLTDSLAQAGLVPYAAADGREALQVLENVTPDLIVSDIKMPNMDGAALCEAIKRDERLAHVPFVVMSVISDRRVMREMTGRGAAAYLVKPFNVEQLVMMSERLLSEHVQILLEENRFFQHDRDGLLDSLFDLISRWEARNKPFAAHSAAVGRLAGQIGKVLGFDDANLRKLECAARLHDVGKVVLPDTVLLKPAPLEPEEARLIESHPAAGAEMLKHSPGLADIIPGVLHHHERMDGSGYPQGLTGESIPLLARIIAVADTYTALVSNRPQRPAYSKDKALQIIDDAKGGGLCPTSVNAFQRHMQQAQGPVRVDSPAPESKPAGKPLHEAVILLVDHNRSFLGFLRRTLAQQGAQNILTASDGKAAWDQINEAPVDVVICERDTPRLNGEELLARVRRSEAFHKLPFIMTSSDSNKDHFQRAVKLLVTDYLIKPLTQNDLLSKISKILAQSSHMQEIDSESDRKEGISPDEFTHVLMEGVLQSHEILCDTVTKRFRFHVRALLSHDLKPEHEPQIDRSGERYHQKIRQLHSKHYVNSVIEVLHKIMDHQTGVSEERVLPGRRVRDISRRFASKTEGVFQASLRSCLEHLPDVAPPEEKIQEIVEDFNAGLRNIITRSDMRNIEILGVGNRYKELKHNSSIDQIRFLKEIHSPKMHWINLVDAFGRGLIEPIESYCTVQDCDPCETDAGKAFPRVFCAPVLKTIKNLIVGREKYNSINAIFLNKVSQYCESKSRFEPDEVKDFYTQGKVQFYIASYLLYILKTLMDDNKRQSFLMNVDNYVKKATGSDQYRMSETHFNMMTSAWARFINENRSKLKSRKAAGRILRRYIPESFEEPRPPQAAAPPEEFARSRGV